MLKRMIYLKGFNVKNIRIHTIELTTDEILATLKMVEPSSIDFPSDIAEVVFKEIVEGIREKLKLEF